MRILITRHAETEQNSVGIIQELNHARFTEKGLEQISKLSARLEKESIDEIISSDLPRCKKTAVAIAKRIGSDIKYSKELREKNDGDWVGRKGHEVNWDSLGKNFETRKVPNGESLQEVRIRGRNFFKDVLNEYGQESKTILIISHATFLRILVGDLIGLGLHDSIFKILIDNCSLTEVDLNEKYKYGCKLKLLNETEFLN